MARSRNKSSPADRAAQWDRERGITPAHRRRAGVWVIGALIAMLVLGVLALALVQPAVGMHAHPGQRGGHGRVEVASCARHQLFAQRCTGTVTEWVGAEHEVGDRVVIDAKSARTGVVDVVVRVRGGTRTDSSGQTNHVETPVVVPADDWIMPSAWRVPFLVGLGLVWVALSWLVAKWVFVWAVGRAKRRQPAQ